MKLLCNLLLLFFLTSLSSEHRQGCYIELATLPSGTSARRASSQQTVPDTFDWSQKVDLSPITNQFLPSLCGSCWAHAAVGALTDRIIIARRQAGDHTPVVPLSPQVLLDCKDPNLGSCNGGSALGAYAFISKNGITDITCSPYTGVDFAFWGEQDSCGDKMCRYCDRFGKCQFLEGPKQYVKSYGLIHGEEDMKQEIYENGPIACSVYAHSDAFENYKDGVIQDPKVYNATTHVVAITGWGVADDGTKFWLGRNSFGSTWGRRGWFQLLRGNNTLDIEEHTCAWAIPLLD